jgi:preprotein translocase subunit SecA
MFGLIKRIFGTAQSRKLKRYARLVPKVNDWEKKFETLTDEELALKTIEFKGRISEGESLESILPEAFAVVKATCRRLCGTEVHVSGYDQKWDMVPYDVQILGAIAMFHGAIAEMQTGEGKTLTASMPLYLNALTGKPVHIVTVNDYLARRDCDWIGSIFRRLGLTVSALTNDVPPAVRKEVYLSDIVYGTASEFGFDYLRDNSMATHKQEQVQRGHYFAIIDEVDSILIDEARTPLIISGPAPESRQMYDELKTGVAELVRHQRDLCNKIATEAKKELDPLLSEKRLSKEAEAKKREAFKRLWLVSKGTPRHKLLKKIKENPDSRAELDKWETFYFGEQNKEEKLKVLSELYILVDERASEYELTDKGIQLWGDAGGQADDFVMLDLGHEMGLIEANRSLSDKEKAQGKLELREADSKRKERAHNLRQMLRAHLLMEKDVDYIVLDNKIVIIDENTGRPQPGRRFSDGLHQAIEAKEEVSIQGETQTYATVTLQNYFRLYERLAGMTGTAMTEAQEFKEIYKLDVLEIPTHRSSKRKDEDDEIYMTEREKYVAILREIKQVHQAGRPILIGTESVEASEKLSRILRQNRLEHTVLNAKFHDKEAEIIAEAGRQGAITISTNMAGRGTDIKLKEGAAVAGGLSVIGTTRHPSRRIDRQLRGRSGRQGDPGSSKFFVSFEDELMRLFASSPRITALLQRYRLPEGEAISAKIVNRSIEMAQKRIEQRNYSIRKHTLEYDDVMNKQRKEVYSFRNEILHTENPLALAFELLQMTAEEVADRSPEQVMALFPLRLRTEEALAELPGKVKTAFQQKIDYQMSLLPLFRPDLADPAKALPLIGEVLRSLFIRKIDRHWIAHLQALDHLRSDVQMRTVGQKDPLQEFKHESFALFASFSSRLREEVSRDLFRFEMTPQQSPEQRLSRALSHMQQKRPVGPTPKVEV